MTLAAARSNCFFTSWAARWVASPMTVMELLALVDTSKGVTSVSNWATDT